MEKGLAKPDALKSADHAQVQASAELLAHLRQMINEPSFSDVVFVCSDGKRVRALRKLLAGRSEMLKNLLFNGMAESGLCEIEFPEISSSVLLSVFEFLYTGNLLEHLPQNLLMSCKVVMASRFFLLPKLEMITHKILNSQISVARTDQQKAASLLTEAMGFKALCDEVGVDLSLLVTSLNSNWSDSIYFQSLSEDAFQYLLANTKRVEDVGKRYSCREYLRFRQVIRWWCYHCDLESDEVDELLNSFVPGKKSALYLCRYPESVDSVDSSTQHSRQLEKASYFSGTWCPFKLDEVRRNSMIRLASNIDCRWIHPVLLATVVQPLEIISDAEIQKSFRFHALRRPMIYKTPECVWKPGGAYCTSEKGYLINRTGGRIGVAVMSAAMFRPNVDYQWRFVIEQKYLFFEVGFMYSWGANPRFDGKLSDQDGARVLQFAENKQRIKGADGRPTWVELGVAIAMPLSVLFNYSTSDGTCRVRVRDIDVGIVWKNLSKENYQPAVSFGASSQARVRIELVSGFDIL